MKLSVNGQDVETDAAADTPILWVLRDHLGIPRLHVRQQYPIADAIAFS